MEPAAEIRRKTEACQSLFSRCLSNPVFSELDWFENRQGEFNLWAASLKAVSIGRSSLDFRLRDITEVRELICDLLNGLSEALTSLLKSAETGPLASTPEPEADLESDEDVGSVFSGFSTDIDDTGSLPGIGKADSPFSEQMFNVKIILEQLTRISAAIRRSGAEYRHQKADASLNEEHFEDFKAYLTVVILKGSIEANTKELVDASVIQARLTDPKPLTAIQDRLIRGNIIRRNRITFATQSMKSAAQQPPPRIIELPDRTNELKARLSQTPAEAIIDTNVIFPQAPKITAPSITQSVPGMGSQLDMQQATVPEKSSSSVVTGATATGLAQQYPSCPKPISGDAVQVQCPYCADLFPDNYSENESRWVGHVAQDILPYMCIYEVCETPDKMYLTSDELLKHMLSQHGVTHWVCDYCSSKSGADQSFIFDFLEDWELHMRKKHAAAFPPSQLHSLAKVSQRRMLDPLACPLCGYVAEHPHSTLDDHIAQHLHGFALRCLPWGTGSDDTDSIDAKDLSDNQQEGFQEESEIEGRQVRPYERHVAQAAISMSSDGLASLADGLLGMGRATGAGGAADTGRAAVMTRTGDSRPSGGPRPLDQARYCGWCGFGPHSIALDSSCTNSDCQRAKDAYATIYPSGRSAPPQEPLSTSRSSRNHKKRRRS